LQDHLETIQPILTISVDIFVLVMGLVEETAQAYHLQVQFVLHQVGQLCHVGPVNILMVPLVRHAHLELFKISLILQVLLVCLCQLLMSRQVHHRV
jgi:hypothetical protein